MGGDEGGGGLAGGQDGGASYASQGQHGGGGSDVTHVGGDHTHDGKGDGDHANGHVNTSQHILTPLRASTPNPFGRKTTTTLDLDAYFSGPRDIAKHSKWPLFLQLHGSITPKLIFPLIGIGAWATLITLLSEKFEHIELSIQPVLLTVTGFVISMGLSFRSSSAYERYGEGRKCWSELILATQTLGRVFWVNGVERPETAKEDLLGKLTAMNLVVAFAVALKHRLRFEPYTCYEDLTDLVSHIDTLARSATEEGGMVMSGRQSIFKSVGENLGVSFATSNPRKTLKRSNKPLGNLPLEILCYLTAYVDEITANGQLPVPVQQTAAYNSISQLNDVLVNTERILNTPLPIAYSIVISQITWLYVILLPFQLYEGLGYITIPATIFGAYIILAILFIGHEIENPFGNDVNDLPLDVFCQHIVQDMETISSRPKISCGAMIRNERNKVLFPHSHDSYFAWASQPMGTIRAALRQRPNATYGMFENGGADCGAESV
ncbi:Bestrophin, RFP-TM, chloride channel-domain-containing protein [Xylaria nigripes]|nr:Bestrophin, RFP-TM, chloride channel-domain-containing protein [Xylaria nigripes]